MVTTASGQTVEVINTDAEGRLVMADAIGRAGTEGPDLIVDVATLTGAALRTLGADLTVLWQGIGTSLALSAVTVRWVRNSSLVRTSALPTCSTRTCRRTNSVR